MQQLGWQVLSCERIVGGYAAEPFYIRARDADGREIAAVYKKLAPGRTTELALYPILGQVPHGVPQLYGVVEEADEQGILLEAAGVPLKGILQAAKRDEQERWLLRVTEMLAELHVQMAVQAARWLAAGVIGPYPYESSVQWGQDAVRELSWLVEQGLMEAQVVTDVRHMVAAFVPRYRDWTAGRTTFTHGDPHLENVLTDGAAVRLIDWEWACVAVPQRDLSILLQDVLDDALHAFAVAAFAEALRRRGWAVVEEEFETAWQACLFDNTLMMLGWEIGKYRDGHVSRAELEAIMTAKLRWLRQSYAALVEK